MHNDELNSPWEALESAHLDDGEFVLAASVQHVTLSSELLSYSEPLDGFLFLDGTPYEGEVDAILRVPAPADVYYIEGGTINNGTTNEGSLH